MHAVVMSQKSFVSLVSVLKFNVKGHGSELKSKNLQRIFALKVEWLGLIRSDNISESSAYSVKIFVIAAVLRLYEIDVFFG